MFLIIGALIVLAFGLDTKNSIYLGHTRLTIIDQSEFGNQPMISECGKKVLIFNGEIYNFREIKNMLPSKLSFDGSSDTKVLLEAICFFGIKKCLEILNGMFAFALWDSDSKELYLARDRCGEKPCIMGRVIMELSSGQN